MIILYLIISFLIFFINYRRKWSEIKKENESSYSNDLGDLWIFWKNLVWLPLFWIILYPVIGLWWLLNKTYDKLEQLTIKK